MSATAMDMADRTVMVTGASGGLGSAVVRCFADRGARLVLVGRNGSRLQQISAAQRVPALVIEADLLAPTQVAQAVEKAVARFGRIDVLCHLAGGFRMGEAVHETTGATWDFLFDLNARMLVHTAQAVVPHMLAQRAGSIVTVGAHSARQGTARMGAYAASKAAMVRLTESMAAELREHGINVNCVLPSIIDTPANRAEMPDADPSRWVAPSDVANVMAFLASDAACAIHGAAVPVTGLT